MSRWVVAAMLLIACAAAGAKHVYPQNLKPVEGGATYVLAEDYVFQEKAATFTLFAGNYVARFEDSRAIYLIGDKACLELSVVPPKNPAAAWAEKWDCGIFLPNDPAKGAAFFVIRRTPDKDSQSGAGLIVDSIIRAGYGSFDFPTSKHNDVVLRSRITAVQISQAQSDVAGRIVDLIAGRLGEERGVHPETAIASAARLAGSFLFSSFGLDLKDCEPGTPVLSVQANEQGPQLIAILGGVLQAMSVPLNAQRLNAHPTARGEEPRLTTLESLHLLRDDALQIARDQGLTLEEAAHAAAVATAFIVGECSRDIGTEVGFNAAAFGFIEGCKTVPPRGTAASPLPSHA